MNIIKTSDGRVAFNADGYVSHSVGNRKNIWLHEDEMIVCHKYAEEGKLHFKFPSEADALKASTEISEQLKLVK